MILLEELLAYTLDYTIAIITEPIIAMSESNGYADYGYFDVIQISKQLIANRNFYFRQYDFKAIILTQVILHCKENVTFPSI